MYSVAMRGHLTACLFVMACGRTPGSTTPTTKAIGREHVPTEPVPTPTEHTPPETPSAPPEPPPPQLVPVGTSAHPIKAPACTAVISHLRTLLKTIEHGELVEKEYVASVTVGCATRWSPEFKVCMATAPRVVDSDACEHAEYQRSPIRARCEAIANRMAVHVQTELDGQHDEIGVGAAKTYQRVSANIAHSTAMSCIETWSDAALACLEASKSAVADQRCDVP